MASQITSNPRLSEPLGLILLAAAVGVVLSLVSYHPLDPSWNTAAGADEAQNLVGLPGAWFSDIVLQALGWAAFLLPAYLTVAAWSLVRRAEPSRVWPKVGGALLLLAAASIALALRPEWRGWGGTDSGGVFGSVVADLLLRYLNRAGAILALGVVVIVALYLLTPFELAKLQALRPPSWKLAVRWSAWRESQRRRLELRRLAAEEESPVEEPPPGDYPPIVPFREPDEDEPPFDDPPEPPDEDEEEEGPKPAITERPDAHPQPELPWDEEEDDDEEDDDETEAEEEGETERIEYSVPATSLLDPPQPRNAYDAAELHARAKQICQKFEEFRVGGSVVQINPGPIVTTFEFKPEPGVKYSKIINLSEDLCMALECESILVERIPGKSTVGIEAPNRKRELISLREVVESKEFRESESPLTVALGKDISGRLKIADLTAMPHLLVAGSTGSGKSVMINAFVMSILLKSTPEQVRFIMIDPKTVELGLYHDIPHLLTPVITDMKKASNALKNATTEMERRLKLLAEHGVRNIDQFNIKVDRRRARFAEENPELADALQKLPYILIIIDELADLMILEGRQIEESITRLAQMARAVGIHLVLATQRPSVDVITGLIKANIPARISFRLATRIDSRTILDTMGAEALLGRGDMLFLPPGTARMMRLHGPFITEEEIEAVVREWKLQGKPRYENEYLAPPEGEEESTEEDAPGADDPAYSDAVRVVLDMGKASTSILQRRLRLGYGRAARLLDAMEREGLIGPPDGSRPRDVLRRPDWLE